MEGRHEYRGEGRGRDRPEQRAAVKPGVPSRRPLVVIMVLLPLLLAALAVVVYFYIQGSRAATKPEELMYGANIAEGDIPGKSMKEVQRELDSVAEEGVLAMSTSATPFGRMSGTDRDINWMIENPSNQGKLIRVEIQRSDTGERVYETGTIPPGSYVESAPLKVSLPPEEYQCTAKFYAYREEDEAYIGQAGVQIKLTLQE